MNGTNGDHRPVSLVQRKLTKQDWDLIGKLSIVKKKDPDGSDYVHVIKPTSANVATLLRYHPDWAGVIARDIFAHKLVTTRVPPWHFQDSPSTCKPGPWTDADTARAQHWFARTNILDMRPIDVSVATIETAVAVAADANEVHPVRDYVRSLTWDGTPRIEGLACNYLGGEHTDYARAVCKCFMIGAIARIMSPGAKVDMCPIFEGHQGKKKSTAMGILAGEWFSDSKIPIGDKDAYQMIQGVWIAELAELGAMSKGDIETVKAFMTSRVDRYRPSYGRHVVDVPRQTVFVGSTNESVYLRDATGSRRFPPLRTSIIDADALARDRDQLWAEAFEYYRAGHKWWLEDELVDSAAEQAEERLVMHPWEAAIRTWVLNPIRAEGGFTLETVLTDCLSIQIDKQDISSSMHVAGILVNRMKWERQRRMENGERHWRYYPSNKARPASPRLPKLDAHHEE